MKKLTFIALATTSALAFSQAHAEDFYGHVFGGVTNNPSTTFSGNIGGAPQTVDTSFRQGTNFGLAIGRSFGEGLRGEIELSRSNNGADTVDFSGNGVGNEANVSGGVNTTSLFANAFFDFDTGSGFKPYVGAGLGISAVDQNVVYGPNVRIVDTDNTFAAQIIIGSAYKLGNGVDLTLDGRYSRAFNVEGRRLNGAGALTGNVESEIDNFSINAGIRFGF